MGSATDAKDVCRPIYVSFSNGTVSMLLAFRQSQVLNEFGNVRNGLLQLQGDLTNVEGVSFLTTNYAFNCSA